MTTHPFDLEPIAPGPARDLYLKHKEANYAQKTVQSHTYRLNHFVRWCEETGLETLSELSGRDLQQYQLWRRDDGDLKQISLNQQMSTIRVILQWCESIEVVRPDLYEKVMVPRVKPENERRDETLSAETAQTILEYLSGDHFASVEHAIFALLWETGND